MSDRTLNDLAKEQETAAGRAAAKDRYMQEQGEALEDELNNLRKEDVQWTKSPECQKEVEKVRVSLFSSLPLSPCLCNTIIVHLPIDILT